MFTDECAVRQLQNVKQFVLRRPDQKGDPNLFTRSKQNGGWSIMFYGGIYGKGRTPLIVTSDFGDTINHVTYQNILDE